MGFGILFLGYLVTFIGAMTPVYAFTQLFGVLILLYALSKLARHNKYFMITFGITLAYLAQSVFTLVGYFIAREEGSTFALIESYTLAAVVLAFHLFLMLAIRDIAIFTSLPKLMTRAIRNVITMGIYCILLLIQRTNFLTNEIALQYVGLASVLLGVIWLILNAALIFSCYMWICLEGEENMDKSPLNIPFLNTINDAMNRGMDKIAERRAERNQEYINAKKNRKKK